jgi:2-oxoglutarate ferredoxin oxidoreductase subunit delta
MAKITIDREKCKGCLLCISFCPKGLISVDKDLNRRGVKPVKFSRQANLNEGGIPLKAGNETPECLGCAMCAIICPDCCIEVYK